MDPLRFSQDIKDIYSCLTSFSQDSKDRHNEKASNEVEESSSFFSSYASGKPLPEYSIQTILENLYPNSNLPENWETTAKIIADLFYENCRSNETVSKTVKNGPLEISILISNYVLYILGELIGSGGQSDVYKAGLIPFKASKGEDDYRWAGRPCPPKEPVCPIVIKIAKFDQVSYSKDVELSDLNGFLPVQDGGEIGGKEFIATELMQGCLLDTLDLKTKPAEKIKNILCQVLSALERLDKPHRDIKAENLLVDFKGEILISDSCGVITPTKVARPWGTAGRIPPDASGGDSPGTRFIRQYNSMPGVIQENYDFYSIGVMLQKELLVKALVANADPRVVEIAKANLKVLTYHHTDDLNSLREIGRAHGGDRAYVKMDRILLNPSLEQNREVYKKLADSCLGNLDQGEIKELHNLIDLSISLQDISTPFILADRSYPKSFGGIYNLINTISIERMQKNVAIENRQNNFAYKDLEELSPSGSLMPPETSYQAPLYNREYSGLCETDELYPSYRPTPKAKRVLFQEEEAEVSESNDFESMFEKMTNFN